MCSAPVQDLLRSRSDRAHSFRISPNPARKVSRNMQLNSSLSPTRDESREPSKSLNASCAPSLLAEGTPAWVSQIAAPILSRIWDGSWSPVLPHALAKIRAKGARSASTCGGEFKPRNIAGRSGPLEKRLSDGPGPSSLERGAREGESPPCSTLSHHAGAVYESGCLGMQPQSGGKFRPRLNMGETDSEQVPRGKDEKDFEKRVKECLKLSGGKRMGPAMRPGRMRTEQSVRRSIRSWTDAIKAVA
ncbi:hypothetical protein Bca4012_102898 [Brassica carinata]